MTISDVNGEAAPEEAAYLRHEANIPRWRGQLRALLTEVTALQQRMKADYEVLKQETYQAGDKEGFHEKRREHETQRAAVSEQRARIEAKFNEAQDLFRELRYKQYGAHVKPPDLNDLEQKLEKARKHIEKLQKQMSRKSQEQRDLYFTVVRIKENMLDIDEWFKPEYLSLRDELLGDACKVLGNVWTEGRRKEEGAKNSLGETA